MGAAVLERQLLGLLDRNKAHVVGVQGKTDHRVFPGGGRRGVAQVFLEERREQRDEHVGGGVGGGQRVEVLRVVELLEHRLHVIDQADVVARKPAAGPGAAAEADAVPPGPAAGEHVDGVAEVEREVQRVQRRKVVERDHRVEAPHAGRRGWRRRVGRGRVGRNVFHGFRGVFGGSRDGQCEAREMDSLSFGRCDYELSKLCSFSALDLLCLSTRLGLVNELELLRDLVLIF